MVQRLRRLDLAIAADAIREAIADRPEGEVRRALGAVARERPDDVLSFFRACLRRVIAAEPIAPPRGIAPLSQRDDDPFAPY